MLPIDCKNKACDRIFIAEKRSGLFFEYGMQSKLASVCSYKGFRISVGHFMGNTAVGVSCKIHVSAG